MKRDLFRKMGEALAAFMAEFHKRGHDSAYITELRKRGKAILKLAELTQEPHLERETVKFVKKLEVFLSHLSDETLAKEVASAAFHLEQETREI